MGVLADATARRPWSVNLVVLIESGQYRLPSTGHQNLVGYCSMYHVQVRLIVRT